MSEEGIVEEQPAEDLTSELEAAFDAAESADEPIEVSVTDTPDAPEIEAVIEEALAPDNWSDNDKTTFKALSELGDQGKTAQEFLLSRHKAMEGDYTQKSQQNAAVLKEYEPIQALFEPHRAQLAASGQTPASVIQRWSQINQGLTNNPQGTIQWLAKQYNVDFDGVEHVEENPEISGLRQELDALRGSITQREQADQQTRLTSVQSQMQEFSELKTDSGELAHPYFADVMEDLVVLAAAERQAGREPDLTAMYDKAVWMNPSTRDKVITSQREAEEKQRLEDARQKAAKAKQAGSDVTGTPDGASPTEDLDLREQLAQAFN